MSKASELSRGVFVRYNGELAVVLELEHRTPGNLRAFYQTKFRNIKSGKLIEQRLRPDEDVEQVRVDVKVQQFLYKDGGSIVCMDNETFEQIYLQEDVLGDSLPFLKEGMNVTISFDGDNPIYAELPTVVELEVTYTEPGMKGDTATRALKPATLETGAQIKVPLFINIGDKIRVDSRIGEYIERAK